ncbi:hypothetical protein ACJX0J_013641, partial [Zea mays]
MQIFGIWLVFFFGNNKSIMISFIDLCAKLFVANKQGAELLLHFLIYIKSDQIQLNSNFIPSNLYCFYNALCFVS